MVRLSALAATAAAAALFASTTVAGADDRAAAAEAYDRGTRAFDAGDFRQAAEHFQAADGLAPSAPALEGALTAATRADDPALAMQLADVADGRKGDPRVDAAARAARDRFQSRAGKLVASCGATTCSLRVANAPWGAGVPRWIAAGDHVVVVDRGAGEERYPIAVRSGETTTWTPPPPASAAPAPPLPVAPAPALPSPLADAPEAPPQARADQAGGGPGRGWFFVGLGATALIGGAAIGTGVATLGAHDAFETAPSDDARAEGLLLQNMTNGLIAGAAVAGVATIVLAAIVDWGGDTAPSASASGVRLRF